MSDKECIMETKNRQAFFAPVKRLWHEEKVNQTTK